MPTTIVYGFVATLISLSFITWVLKPYLGAILGNKPTIVKDFAQSELSFFSNVIETLRWYFVPTKGSTKDASKSAKEASLFDDLILPREIKQCILDLAHSVSNARNHSLPFTHRHIILHGPDGVGKSMTAKKIASIASLDYAHISGRAVHTTGEESVMQIQGLFMWAKSSSPKGIILFIDDAETFLGSEESSFLMNDTTVGQHNALSAFLYNLAKIRKGIIIVLSVNRKQDLDKEVLAHFDESLYLPLPDSGSRTELIHLYFNMCVYQAFENYNKNASSFKSQLIRFFTRQPLVLLSIDEDLMTGDQLEDIVAASRGLSGDDIRNLMTGIQSFVKSSENGRLDFATVWRLVEAKVKFHRDSQVISGEHAISYLDGDIDLQDVTFI